VSDADALANAIALLASDEGLRQSIGRNAMKTVTENYTWIHYGQQVAGYLREAAGMAKRVTERKRLASSEA
jgi:glycosyltransferase involved in cell wall biosynthesis